MERWGFCLVLGFCALAGAQVKDVRPYFDTDAGYYAEIYRRELVPTDDYAALKSWVAAHGLKSVDEVLAAFAKDPYYRTYLADPVLIHDSDSRQADAVSAPFPRIVMHHPQSRLILAVTGNPAFADFYREMEIIQLTPNDREFAFHLADFSPGASSPFVDQPMECRRCHGKPSRPIWGTYRLWTGAYGGFDDKIETPAERKLWDDFEKGNYHRGRYAYLRGEPPRYHTTANMGPRVNDMLNQIVGDLNARRVAATLTESPAWEKYRFLLMSVLRDCRDPLPFLPEALRAEHERRLGGDVASLKKELERSGRAEFATRVARYAAEFGYTRLEDLDRFGPPTDGGLRTNFDDSELLFWQAARVRYLLDGQAIDPLWRLQGFSVSFDRHYPNNFSFTGTEAALFEWLERTYLPRRLRASRDAVDRELAEMGCAALEQATKQKK